MYWRLGGGTDVAMAAAFLLKIQGSAFWDFGAHFGIGYSAFSLSSQRLSWPNLTYTTKSLRAHKGRDSANGVSLTVEKNQPFWRICAVGCLSITQVPVAADTKALSSVDTYWLGEGFNGIFAGEAGL